MECTEGGRTRLGHEGLVGGTFPICQWWMWINGTIKRHSYLLRQLSPTRGFRSMINVGMPRFCSRAAEVRPPCPAPG